jgi:hypothetical protein
MIEPLGLTIADGTIGKERRKAASAVVEQRPFVLDVEEGLLLPGKTRVGEILCGGAGPDRDVNQTTVGSCPFMRFPLDLC